MASMKGALIGLSKGSLDSRMLRQAQHERSGNLQVIDVLDSFLGKPQLRLFIFAITFGESKCAPTSLQY
jgi:hypothetical protein